MEVARYKNAAEDAIFYLDDSKWRRLATMIAN